MRLLTRADRASPTSPTDRKFAMEKLQAFSKCHEQELVKFASAFNDYAVPGLIIDENGWKSPPLFFVDDEIVIDSFVLTYKQNDCNKESVEFMSILKFFQIYISKRFR